MTRAVDVAGRELPPNTALGVRNLLINGNFDIWQRGTSFTYTATTYNADRWVSWSGGASTISREEFTFGQTDVPNNPKYFLRYTGNGSSTGVRIDQRIENLSQFKGRSLVVTFYARSSNSMTPGYIFFAPYDVSTATNYNNFSTEPVLATTSAWQKFTYTCTPSSFPTEVDDSVDYFQFGFRIPNNYNGTFDIAQVQLEFGTEATEFEYRPYDMELARCQRYYETGTARWRGYDNGFTFVGTNFFKVKKRAIPTIGASAGSAADITIEKYSSVMSGGNFDTGGFTFTADAEL